MLRSTYKPRRALPSNCTEPRVLRKSLAAAAIGGLLVTAAPQAIAFAVTPPSTATATTGTSSSEPQPATSSSPPALAASNPPREADKSDEPATTDAQPVDATEQAIAEHADLTPAPAADTPSPEGRMVAASSDLSADPEPSPTPTEPASPQIVLSPDREIVIPGGTVTIRGKADTTFEGQPVHVLLSTGEQADATVTDGTFSVDFTIPLSATAGDHITVSNSLTVDTVTLTVATPTLSAQPAHVVRGNRFTVTGTGWPAAGLVVMVGDDEHDLTADGIDGNGGWAISVPTSKTGTIRITAGGLETQVVVDPTMSASDTALWPGDRFLLTSKGNEPGSDIEFDLSGPDGATVTLQGTADEDGTAAVVVDPDSLAEAGTWTALAGDVSTDTVSFRLADPHPLPASGTEGQKVTLQAADVKPGSTVTFSVDSDEVGTAAAGDDGTVELQVRAPDAGRHTITISQGRRTARLDVDAKPTPTPTPDPGAGNTDPTVPVVPVTPTPSPSPTKNVPGDSDLGGDHDPSDDVVATVSDNSDPTYPTPTPTPTMEPSPSAGPSMSPTESSSPLPAPTVDTPTPAPSAADSSFAAWMWSLVGLAVVAAAAMGGLALLIFRSRRPRVPATDGGEPPQRVLP